jgi:hypothetical protein
MNVRSARFVRVLGLVALVVGAGRCATSPPSSEAFSTPVESCAAKAEPTAQQAVAGGDITPPKVIRRVEPHVSDALVHRGASATLAAVIGEDGRPRHICIQSGDAEWGSAMTEALQQWVFEPGTIQGKPIPVLFNITSTLRR